MQNRLAAVKSNKNWTQLLLILRFYETFLQDFTKSLLIFVIKKNAYTILKILKCVQQMFLQTVVTSIMIDRRT